MRASDIQHIITGLVEKIGKNNIVDLSPGKVITAFLKEVQGNSCTLLYDGKEITARLETELSPGQNLKLLVESEKNGQTILKLISDNANENEIPIKSITGRLGLKESNLNQKLVGEMIKQQMPLTSSSAAKLSGFIRSLDLPEQEAWIPVFMAKNGIQLTRQNFTGVKGLLTDLQFIHDDLAALSEGLKSFIKAERGGRLVEMAQQVVDILNKLELNPDRGSESIAAKLEQAVRLLTQMKKDTVQEVKGDSALKRDSGDKAAVAVQNDNKPLSNKNTTQSVSINNTNNTGNYTNYQVRSKHEIQEVKAVESEVVGDLGPMLEKLSLNFKEYNTGEHKEISRLIQNINEKIEFVRNFNLKTDVGQEGLMVFYSTVRFEDSNAPLRLLVKYRDGKEKNRNLSTCRLEIELNTPGLGTVKSEVQVANKNLTVQFVTASEPAGKVLDLYAAILAERLSKMDYIMNYLPSRVEIEPDNSFLPDTGVEMQGLFQLDLTV